MVMVIMMALPKLNTELLVITMLVILFTVQMMFMVFHIMCMETMARMLQLLLFLPSCSSKLLSKKNASPEIHSALQPTGTNH